MIDSKTYTSTDGTRKFKVSIHQDQFAESPRDDMESPTAMVTMDRNYRSPDKGGDPTQYAPFDHFEDSRRLSRYINLFRPDILAYGFLDREPRDGTLSVSFDTCDGDRPDGIIVIDRVEAERFGISDFTPEQFRASIKADVATYNAWATGQVYGWELVELITCDHGDEHEEDLEACWGYYVDEYKPYGEEYADIYDEAVANIPVEFYEV